MEFMLVSGVMACMMMIIWVDSPSLSMLGLLVGSVLLSGYVAISWNMKLQSFLLLLMMVGGLFVLISFVVLSNPWDFSKISMGLKEWVGLGWVGTNGWCFWYMSGSRLCLGYQDSGMESLDGVVGVEGVSYKYIIPLLLILSGLLLVLFLVNGVLKQSKGGSFQSG